MIEGIAAGLLVGNWLVVPLALKERTFKEGFIIGVMDALLALGFYVVI